MDNILLTTGGTGGHIFPALAVAEELRRRNPNANLLFVGSLYGPEERLMRQAGIPFEGLPVRGLLGRGFKAVGAGAQKIIGPIPAAFNDASGNVAVTYSGVSSVTVGAIQQ